MAKKKLTQKPESTYKRMMTYTCPARGLVTEEIEVKVYGAANHEPVFDEELTAFLTQEGVIEAPASLADLMAGPF